MHACIHTYIVVVVVVVVVVVIVVVAVVTLVVVVVTVVVVLRPYLLCRLALGHVLHPSKFQGLFVSL